MRFHSASDRISGSHLIVGLASLCLLAGCGDAAVNDDASIGPDVSAPDGAVFDAGSTEDAGTTGPHVRVGTGQDEFNALSSGERVEFFMGPESNGDPLVGFHIWGAVRGEGLDPVGTTVGFEVLSQDGTEILGASATRRVTLLPDGTGGFQGYGFPAVLEDCCAVRDRALKFRVRVTDGAQVVFTNEVEILGAIACRTGTGSNVCP